LGKNAIYSLFIAEFEVFANLTIFKEQNLKCNEAGRFHA